ncbi:hypothetical protein N7516_009579 [Penicillium verrucosum]|uniref:uncharacterized protein n=1 Tax=Penicillium verrucosum TaxID=60171 RepID=UPI002545BD4E|nr:uncharacterized protein N7516_009579 [Penicillium verrucosum]KAJ5921876.1 hypothetical protein N7516_009579 [Penicillium verrucosum]
MACLHASSLTSVELRWHLSRVAAMQGGADEDDSGDDSDEKKGRRARHRENMAQGPDVGPLLVEAEAGQRTYLSRASSVLNCCDQTFGLEFGSLGLKVDTRKAVK